MSKPGEWISDADEEVDYQMSVRAKNRGALLMAIGRYAGRAEAMPAWLAEAISSPWGKLVMTNVMKDAERVLGIAPRSG